MPLDPVLQELVDHTNANPPPAGPALPVAEQRRLIHELIESTFTAFTEPGPELPDVHDEQVAGSHGAFGVRIYTPDAPEPHPALVYLHGGAWWLGDLAQVDAECRSLAHGASCVVVSVDYHLAPEHKFPIAVEDCYAALCWTAKNAERLRIDPRRIAVGGASAGGNLAACVALMARDRGGPALAFQLLDIPATDTRLDAPSMTENGSDYVLTRAGVEQGWGYYLRGTQDASNPYASPMHAESLTGLPPALVITCEYDPLRDEGEAYARRLEEAGVPTTCKRYDGLIHGALMFTKLLPQARACRDQKIAALAAALG